jgi:hypothetical protein
MEDKINLVETEQIYEKIQKIIRQTDYNEEEAKDKLIENGFDEILTIKAYLGITEKKNSQVTSLNQEIYKQLRYKLDNNMRDYKTRVENGEAKKII